ncbi:MAG TPA: redoxin domain-containing protein [Bryobacteraceae bacterium]|nr:redoxin domain-containing protein [Bryobacteraceae bacterium]
MGAAFRIAIFAVVCAASSAAREITFSMPDAGGKTHSSAELRQLRATVLLFVATDCPNSNTYAPVLARLYREYASRGVQFLGVYSDPSDNAAAVEKHDGEYRIRYPGLLDPDHTLALGTGARSTPEAVILSPAGEVLYLGRVDDRFVEYGKTRYRPAHEDLRDALDQILSGQPVKNPVTNVLGCAILGVN